MVVKVIEEIAASMLQEQGQLASATSWIGRGQDSPLQLRMLFQKVKEYRLQHFG